MASSPVPTCLKPGETCLSWGGMSRALFSIGLTGYVCSLPSLTWNVSETEQEALFWPVLEVCCNGRMDRPVTVHRGKGCKCPQTALADISSSLCCLELYVVPDRQCLRFPLSNLCLPLGNIYALGK